MTQQYIAEITALMVEWNRTHREPPTMRAAQQQAATAFAALNGWRLRSHGSLPMLINARSRYLYPRDHHEDDRDLRRYFDHRLCFRQSAHPYVVTAIVSQPYQECIDTLANVAAAAQAIGLTLHTPQNLLASFHYPGRCAFLVFTRPETTVRFLPEQQCVT